MKAANLICAKKILTLALALAFNTKMFIRMI